MDSRSCCIGCCWIFRLEKQQEQDYAKKIEERRLDQVIADRVSRNLRLDLDKGRHIDLEC